MKIFNFEILSDGDVVENIIGTQVHVRKSNGTYIVYTFHLENPELMDFDVFVVQKGDGFISVKLNADLSDLDKTLGTSND